MRTATLSDRIRRLLRGSSRGVTLIEVLVAMAIVGIIAVAFLGGLATASRSAAIADVRTNGESLARTHLEYVKSQDYHYGDAPWGYRVTREWGSQCLTPDHCPNWLNEVEDLSDEHALYTVNVRAVELEENLQQITVTVFHHSRDEAVITLAGYKVDR